MGRGAPEGEGNAAYLYRGEIILAGRGGVLRSVTLDQGKRGGARESTRCADKLLACEGQKETFEVSNGRLVGASE